MKGIAMEEKPLTCSLHWMVKQNFCVRLVKRFIVFQLIEDYQRAIGL